MDIKTIRDMTVIAELLNISHAADFLGVSQPALSRELNSLEDKLGCKLFTRLSKGLQISPEGKLYIETFNRILSELKSTDTKIKHLNSAISGHFSLSIHPVVANYILPNYEKKMSEHSGIRTDYNFVGSREATENVVNCKSDLAIVADAGDFPDIVRINLWTDNIGLYSKDGKEKAKLLYNPHMIHAKRFLKKYQGLNIKEIADYTVLYAILKGSNMMGILPNPLAEQDNKLKLIRRFYPAIEISLIFRADRKKTQALQTIIKSLKSCSRKTA